jgi:biopolymer transport protein ExbD
MALRRNNAKEGFALDLTSCSDIIFTLLLFYILTQNFLPQPPLELPAIASQTQGSTTAQRVEVAQNGQLSLNGEDMTADAIVMQISKKVSNASATQIIIYASRLSPAGVSIELLDRLRQAGISRVAFAGRPENEK